MTSQEYQVAVLAALWDKPEGLAPSEVYARFHSSERSDVCDAMVELEFAGKTMRSGLNRASPETVETRLVAIKGGMAGYGRWLEDAQCQAS